MGNVSCGVLWQRANELFGKPRSQWKTVDEMIYGVDNYFNVPKDRKEKREKAIKEAFKFHYQNNLFYHRFCKQRGVTPADIKTENDFHKIPMMPDTFFKDYPSEDPRDVYEWLYRASSVDIGEYDFNGKSLQKFLEWAENRLNGLVLHSSGTSGKFSIMFRDEETMRRLFHVISKLLLFHIVPVDDNLHLVYPGTTKTHLAMGHAVAKASEIFDDEHKHFLTNRALTMELVKLMSTGIAKGIKQKLELKLLQKAMTKGQYDIIELLQKLEKKKEQVIILSFPFQVWDLMDIMEKEGITLNLGESNSFMVTAGGWKIFAHKKVTEKEFAARVEKMFGIPKENYRDAYGMSEMNGLALSCEGRYKHMCEWIYPQVLDDDLEPMGFGEWGRFAFLDPAGYGYPGFIMTGDRVKLLEECPKCGRSGMVLESEITRMSGAEARGCGNLMRNLLTQELRK
ncbi:MAG TPA: hypothetical protein ENI45_00010 [Thermoplasmatales archaeon]|nr:hypothetical protein [Thermoplasmatales archaeon]